MTEGEKSVISLFIIGALIVVGKVLAGGEPIPHVFLLVARCWVALFRWWPGLPWYSFQTCQPRPCADLAPCWVSPVIRR